MRSSTLTLVLLTCLTLQVAAQPAPPADPGALCATGSLYVEPGTLGSLRNSIVEDLRKQGSFPPSEALEEGMARLVVTPRFDTSSTPPKILMTAEVHDRGTVTFVHQTRSYPDLRGAAREVVTSLAAAFTAQCPNGPVARAADPYSSDQLGEPGEEAEPLIANMTPEAQELLDQAVALHEQGRLEDAVKMWKRYLKLMPQDSFGYANLAITYLQIKDYRAAAKALERSVRLNGHNDIALYNLAYTYYKLSRPLMALRAIEATLKVNPWNEKALNLLAQMRREGI